MSPTAFKRPRRRRLVAGLLAGAAVWAGSVAPHAARAAEPAAVGWWWAAQPSDTLPLLVRPLPAVPEGGLYVSGDASGPSGVSALRFEVEDEARMEALTIRVADTVGSPVVDACAAAGAWEAVDGGSWDERPTPDCDAGRAVGVLSDDGTSIRFELLAFAGDDALDVVLVPGSDPDSGQRATFSASFEPPDAGSLTVVAPAPASPPATASPPPTTDGGASPAPFVTTPSPGSFALPPPVPPPIAGDPPPEAVAAPSLQPTPVFGVPAPEGFEYAAVFVLPLLLLVLGSYLARSLTRPVAARVRTG